MQQFKLIFVNLNLGYPFFDLIVFIKNFILSDNNNNSLIYNLIHTQIY